MELPYPLSEHLNTKQFWLDWFMDQYELDCIRDASKEGSDCSLERPQYEELKGLLLEFPVSQNSALVLQTLELYSFISLQLGFFWENANYEIAFIELACGHSPVLRWDELDLIARATMLTSREWPSIYYPILLLQTFVPYRRGKESSLIHVVRKALNWTELFYPHEIKRLINNNIHWAGGDEEWIEDPVLGWHLDNAETLRTKEVFESNKPFPFQEWKWLLEGAEQTWNQFVLSLAPFRTQLDLKQQCAQLLATKDFRFAHDMAEQLEAEGFGRNALIAGLRNASCMTEIAWLIDALMDRPRGETLEEIQDKRSVAIRPIKDVRIDIIDWDSEQKIKALPDRLIETVGLQILRALRRRGWGDLDEVGSGGSSYSDQGRKMKIISESKMIHVRLWEPFEKGEALVQEILAEHGLTERIVDRDEWVTGA